MPLTTMLRCSKALLSMVLFFSAGPLGVAEEPARPNIIFIIADDMYLDMFNCTEAGKGRNLTPALDRLADEGVVMRGQHIVSPVCTPSRFNCLTGRYASRTRSVAFTKLTEKAGMSVVTWNTLLMPKALTEFLGIPEEVTLPRFLQRLGYRTGTVGKHHSIAWPGLDRFLPTDDPRDPAVASRLQSNGRKMEESLRQLGFDFATNIVRGNVDHGYPDGVNVHNLDWTTQGALEFLDSCRAQPFFLFFSTTVAHSPYQPDQSWLADPRATGYGYLEEAPKVLPSRESLPKRIREAGVTGGRFPEMVLWLDDAVGALMTRLEERGLDDNTVVFFFNDNGQDAKGSIYQGGASSPSLVWRKGGFPCGHSTETHITNLDFAPTMLELAGGHPPVGFFDGRSFLPVLEGKSDRVHKSLFFELGFTRGVRMEDWKYIALRYPPNPEKWIDLRKPEQGRGTDLPDPASPADMNPRPPYGHIGGNNNEDRPKRVYPGYWDRDQLYDLSRDPNEQQNLAEDPAHAEKLAELKGEMQRHLQGLPGGFAELKP